MKFLISYCYPVETSVCLRASTHPLFFFFFYKVKKKKSKTFIQVYKGHTETHYHRGRPMNCKKSLMTLGKEWKWVMSLGHNDRQIEEAQCPAPQTVRKSGEGEQFHESA